MTAIAITIPCGLYSLLTCQLAALSIVCAKRKRLTSSRRPGPKCLDLCPAIYSTWLVNESLSKCGGYTYSSRGGCRCTGCCYSDHSQQFDSLERRRWCWNSRGRDEDVVAARPAKHNDGEVNEGVVPSGGLSPLAHFGCVAAKEEDESGLVLREINAGSWR